MKARNHARRFEAKVHLLVVLHAVSERSEVLYRRGACIRIAAPGRRLREGRIRRSSQLRSRYSRQMVRADVLDLILWPMKDHPKALYPAWEVPARAYGSPMLSTCPKSSCII